MTAKNLRLATAESCTGGAIAAACTALAGSSAWFERGFVTYSNEAKTELLGVPADLIAAHGAVSQPVALAMARGALAHSHAHAAIAVTGIAGPGGGTPAKPVGTVWIAWAWLPAPPEPGSESATAFEAQCHHLPGERAAVRHGAVRAALDGLLARLRGAH